MGRLRSSSLQPQSSAAVILAYETGVVRCSPLGAALYAAGRLIQPDYTFSMLGADPIPPKSLLATIALALARVQVWHDIQCQLAGGREHSGHGSQPGSCIASAGRIGRRRPGVACGPWT
jgi:hypothetical protein